MSMILDGSNGVTFNDASLQGAAASPFTLKNRIINGDMRIDQRNAGAAVTTSGAFPVDRFAVENSSDGAFSAQQDSTAPTGFVNSLKVTVTTADASIGATQLLQIQHKIEGLNVADLAWGTANAKTVTLSFWVRSSLTGTFGGAIINSANDRSYPFTYTISSANTFEYKTITIAGDTSGTWLTTNGVGLKVNFGLGIGSTYSGTAGLWAGALYLSATGATAPLSTLNSTFYITGVQLEQNTSATPFERRLFNQELANCQRYYAKTYDIGTVPGTASSLPSALCSVANGANTLFTFQHPVNMRAIPTVSLYAPVSGTIDNIQSGSTSVAGASNGSLNGTKNSMSFSNACITADAYVHMVASAEL
jgi:hypothetical protein